MLNALDVPIIRRISKWRRMVALKQTVDEVGVLPATVLAVHNYDGSYERTELEALIDGVIAVPSEAFSTVFRSIDMHIFCAKWGKKNAIWGCLESPKGHTVFYYKDIVVFIGRHISQVLDRSFKRLKGVLCR